MKHNRKDIKIMDAIHSILDKIEVVDAISSKLDNIIDSLKLDKKQFEEKLSAAEDEKNKLTDMLKDAEEKRDWYNGEKEYYKKEFQKVSDELNNKTAEFDEVKNKVNSLKAEKDKVLKELDSERDNTRALESSKKALEKELEVERERASSLEEEKNDVCEKLINEKCKIEEFEVAIKTIETELAEAKNVIDSYEAENCELRSAIESEKENNNKLSEEKNGIEAEFVRIKAKADELSVSESEFRNAAEPFVKIAELMFKCPSMEWLINDELKLSSGPEMSVTDIITFINRFAWDFTFARLIYDSMSKSKSKTQESITDDELVLVNAVNDYYKEKYDFVDFDVLDCMEITDGREIEFDRKKMADLNDSFNYEIATAKKLYVPALITFKGKLERKALIEG